MNVLSLFDGISCGMVALERAGVKVDKYYASEIEPNAIKISQKNYPNIIRLGDVTKWREWDIDWTSIGLLIGGSPCQGFSIAGKQLNFEDPRSKLFFEYVNILNHIRKFNPNVKFLLENVRMKKEYLGVITEKLGVEPTRINSELITPMRRDRWYWFNWSANISGISTSLTDVLDAKVDESFFLADERYEKLIWRSDSDIFIKNLANKKIKVEPGDGVILSRTWQTYMPLIKRKSHCIRSANPDDSGVAVSVHNQIRFRKFTLNEMERMQTLPVGYTKCKGVTERKSKSCIGNAWTVDIIAHILKGLPVEEQNEPI